MRQDAWSRWWTLNLSQQLLTYFATLSVMVGDVSGDLSIRGKLSHMLHKVLDHLQMTLHVVTKGRVSTLHSNTIQSYVIYNQQAILLTLLNAIMRLEIFLLSWLSTSAPYCTSRRTTSSWPPTSYNVNNYQARFRQYSVCVCVCVRAVI